MEVLALTAHVIAFKVRNQSYVRHINLGCVAVRGNLLDNLRIRPLILIFERRPDAIDDLPYDLFTWHNFNDLDGIDVRPRVGSAP